MRNIGISSLLVIFTVICMVTFAALSLSTAQSELKLSQKSAEYKTSYYEACNKAEEKINQIMNGESPESTGAEISGDTVYWEIPSDENHVLQAKVRLTHQDKGLNHEIIFLKNVYNGPASYNGTLNLL